MDSILVDSIFTAVRSISKRTQTMAITSNSLFVEDLALDSLDLVGVLMKLEDHYEIKIDLDDVPNIRTVADLAAYLDKLVGGRYVAA